MLQLHYRQYLQRLIIKLGKQRHNTVQSVKPCRTSVATVLLQKRIIIWDDGHSLTIKRRNINGTVKTLKIKENYGKHLTSLEIETDECRIRRKNKGRATHL